ncbi:MAG: methionine synthase [Actinobacteria bacterium]|uniref:Unannotated protein n=1 Tax=freshwater metagenome TaxID=449393 RepID=A0A6J6PTH4_9ZZZZ|nr:methionine synthase [Actinomycetota bacterium]MSY87943.1 methionine synthase [Actinomycetota bacterium]MTA50803.1 methionine synthase [Actinomycetota bacterium]
MLITGIGSLSGENPREAAELVFDLFPQLPFIPELPSAGVGSDFIGRSASMLHDLHVDVQPSGWRIVDKAGADERRAKGAMSHSVDAFHEVFDGFEGRIKIQVAGPLTFVALLETSRAGSILSDEIATKDVAQSLAYGVEMLVADMRRRLPGVTSVVVQIDEPLITQIMRGAIKSASGFGRIRIPSQDEVISLIALFARDNELIMHSCANDLPIELIGRSAINALSLDASFIGRNEYEALAELHDRGKSIWLGVVGGVDRHLPPVSATVTFVQNLARDIGLPLERLALTHTCGLAGASPHYARTSTAHLVNVSQELQERAQ